MYALDRRYEVGEERLSRYRVEACRASLIGRAWRRVAALALRYLAGRLEPQPVLQLG
jgi:hypothetical protein